MIIMIPKYYIETSIPSFYHDTRTAPQFQAMREWTRQWWDMSKPSARLVTSQPVFLELSKAPSPKKELGLELIDPLPRLPYSPEIDEIVALYIWDYLILKSLHRFNYCMEKNANERRL